MIDAKGRERRGDWMQTYSGKQFFALDPLPEDIEIIDIASGLSKATRYGGQCLRFYSVAEHCCHICDAAPEAKKLEALMHDASEAYLADIPRPIKGSLSNYAEIEHGLMTVIAEKYGFAWPVSKAVKSLDNGILLDEFAQNMAPAPVPWSQWTDPALNCRLQFWNPYQAMIEFVTRFFRYWKGGAA